MGLRIAIQMDHPAGLNLRGDSTLALALEGQRRGHRLFYYAPPNLVHANGQLTATDSQSLAFFEDRTPHYELGAPHTLSLHEVDAVLMRQDPPYHMAYLSATYLLDHLEGKTPVFNSPRFVRNEPEKLSILHFPDFIPPTLVTRSDAEILAFRAQHGAIVVKPLYGFGGRSVYKFEPGDSNLLTLLEQFAQQSAEPLMVQAFLPQVVREDKRVILIDGKICGVTGRIPAEGEIRANFRVGGTAAAVELNARQRQICETVGAWLAPQGVLFAGLDLIGDYLTEINTTSPTGLRAIQQLYGTDPSVDFWDALERRVQA